MRAHSTDLHSLLTTPIYSRMSWSRRLVTLRHRSRALKMDVLSSKAFVIISILSENGKSGVEDSRGIDYGRPKKTLHEQGKFLRFRQVGHLAFEYFQIAFVALCNDFTRRWIMAKFDKILGIFARNYVQICVFNCLISDFTSVVRSSSMLQFVNYVAESKMLWWSSGQRY